MRLDLLLKSFCLVKTRSQGKKGCEAGRIRVNGLAAKASREVAAGDLVEISYPDRELLVEVIELPGGQVSRKERERYYRVVRETRRPRGPELDL
jgi:ribosome-associated heat shock protein Hsp15